MPEAKKFRKKPVVIEAVQWFTSGDHPDDDCTLLAHCNVGDEPFLSEGHVVRYYRHPQDSGERRCEHCSRTMNDHGWIETLEGGHIVCPGDWIITGVRGEHYPVKDQIFRETYEEVADA